MWTFGYTLLKAEITLPNAVASPAVQMPSNVTEPETARFTLLELALDLPFVPATARPAARRASTVTSPTTTMRVRLMELLSWFRRRSRARSQDRRSEVHARRPRPRAARRRGHGSAR